MSLTLDDFTNEAESQPEVETTETETETTVAETESEATPESEETVTEVPEENVEAESQEPTYEPDFTYKIKDEVKEFPDWMKEAVKSKEHEEQIRDYLTKAHGIDSIKESRSKIEEEFNSYREEVESKVAPTIQRISQFENAINVGNYGEAMKLANMDPNKMVDYMLMDEQQSQMVYKKVLDAINLEDQGPQALEAKRMAHQESIRTKELEAQNQTLEQKLQQIEAENYNQMVNFSLSQNQEAVNQYDSVNGQGAFEKFVRDYGHMKWQQGEKLAPAQCVQEVLRMVNINNTVAPQGNPVNPPITNTAPAAPQKPATIPNIGSGVNSSVVGKSVLVIIGCIPEKT